jgi:hypothetical protein
MAQQIMFFKKNWIDLSKTATLTITDSVASNSGQSYVNFMRNRNNFSAWMTTGSTDAANTQIDIDMVDSKDVGDILIVKHNLKSYTIQYWNGSAYVDFSTTIAPTNDTASTSHYSFNQTSIQKIRIIITGTQVADSDKRITQLIVTEKIVSGQLTGWPQIKKPTLSTNKKISKSLSGKASVIETVGYFAAQLSVASYSLDADLQIVEQIYNNREGVLMWLCGGDQTQFKTIRQGYRLEDIYLVRPVDDYVPEYINGQYQAGIKFQMSLQESID